jgi:hypothetical protein
MMAEMNETALVLPPLNISLKDVGKPIRNRKLTIQKRRIFFKELMKDFNPSRAASVINVTRKAVDEMYERDERFKAKWDEIDQALQDQTASVNILVSQTPSREGYNDRKLFLESRHPLYKKNPDQINIAVINTHEATGELHGMLNKIPINTKK